MKLEAQIRKRLEPIRARLELLTTIPGVSETATASLVTVAMQARKPARGRSGTHPLRGSGSGGGRTRTSDLGIMRPSL